MTRKLVLLSSHRVSCILVWWASKDSEGVPVQTKSMFEYGSPWIYWCFLSMINWGKIVVPSCNALLTYALCICSSMVKKKTLLTMETKKAHELLVPWTFSLTALSLYPKEDTIKVSELLKLTWKSMSIRVADDAISWSQSFFIIYTRTVMHAGPPSWITMFLTSME